MVEKRMEIIETNEAGDVTATYFQSLGPSSGLSRVDVVLPTTAKSTWQTALDVFLPVGYPHSVTKDYTEYQIYDSLQAFSSSIAGLLSSRAVLSSVGVGDASASPTAALLLRVFQESSGRLATILFAHRFGTAFEPECKMYRLLADILNDIAFILDCLSPVFPKAIRLIILSLSSVLRALCGVAAGSAKASLSAHFAKWGNLGELNAKDSSQETVISLVGMAAGTFVVSWVTTPIATWTALILLLSIHLETNRRAVRAVIMNTFNRQRASLVYHQLVQSVVPTPVEVSRSEQIFAQGSVLRDRNGRRVGNCVVGASFGRLLRSISKPHATTQSNQVATDMLQRLLHLFQDRNYILWVSGGKGNVELIIVIKKSASSRDLLIAWWHALTVAIAVQKPNRDSKDSSHDVDDESLQIIAGAGKVVDALWTKHEDALRSSEWDFTAMALETTSSHRVVIE